MVGRTVVDYEGFDHSTYGWKDAVETRRSDLHEPKGAGVAVDVNEDTKGLPSDHAARHLRPYGQSGNGF